MINLAVINLKNLLKSLIKIIIVALIVAMIFKFICIVKSLDVIGNIKNKILNAEQKIIQSSTSIFDNNDITETISKDLILDSELSSFNYENDNKIEIESENLEIGKLQEDIKIKSINNEVNDSIDLRGLVTKVVDANNKIDTYTNVYGSVKIKNESAYTLTEEMLNPNVKFTNTKDILIFHTHTCESYTATEQNNYVSTGNFRTTDLNYSVARVGTELTNCLMNKGYNVIHDTTYHDYPAYNGSYTRSLTTVKNILSNNKSIELVIDLHRDALGSSSSYAPTVNIGEEQVAQIMFVIGTNGGGLTHDNWNKNLKLAILIQQKANEMYPGLFKPIILRNSRYNQNVADGACIIEVGATGNTLEQSNASMKYLAEVLSEVMK
ncbi:MAG: stage II sporulation protein P [Candidatus Scatovivens sp.]